MNFKNLLLFCLVLSALYAEPQLTFGLGSATLSGEEFRYKGNSSNLEYTFNPYNRLQFGLKYDNTSAIVSQHETYNCSGLLGSFKIVLNTLSNKSPYLGFNAGWLNSTLANETILYNARGSFTGEAVAGYTFRLDDYNRLNLEYRNRYIELKLADKELQRSEILTLSWSMILAENEEPPVTEMSKAEGLSTKKSYLQKKISYNNSQIEKYDKLLSKYNQRILQEGSTEQLTKERDYLVEQKKELETNNQKMWELIER